MKKKNTIMKKLIIQDFEHFFWKSDNYDSPLIVAFYIFNGICICIQYIDTIIYMYYTYYTYIS